MNLDPAEVKRLRDVAEQAIADLERRRPAGARLERLWQDAMSAAQQLLAATQRHISIGFAGDVSKGKSLLISLITGYARLLAVADAPATGNLTRIVVRRSATARPPQTALGFMTPEIVVDMVEFLLKGIREHAARSGRYDLGPLRDYHPVDAAHPDRADWAPLEDFFRAWWHEPTMNLKLREWATELFGVRDALRAGSGLLARTRGQLVGVDPLLLDDAVRIGGAHSPSEEFPEPAYAPPIHPDRLTAAALERVKPLIDQVVVTVTVDPAVLDIGETVEFVDFPGLDSGSLRDRYLITRELPRTTLVAVLVDGREPTSDTVKEFFSMLEDGRRVSAELDKSMLVVGNKFDPVEPPDPPATSLAELASRSDNIEALTAVVGELTRRDFDRFALVSALRANDHLGAAPPRGATAHDLRVAHDSGARWAPTVARLWQAHPGHGLVVALARFTDDDGGLGHLRRLLTRQVREHGERIWLAEAHALEEQYRQARDRLDEEQPVPHPVPPGEQRLAQVDELVRRLRAAVDRLKPSLQQLVLLPHQQPDGRLSLDDLVEKAAAEQVQPWAGWGGTLGRLDAGLIQVGDDTPTAASEPDDGLGYSFGDPDWAGDPGVWVAGTGPAADTGPSVLRATADLDIAYRASRELLVGTLDELLRRRVDDWATQIYRDLALTDDAKLLAERGDDLERLLATRGARAAREYVAGLRRIMQPTLLSEQLDRLLAARAAAGESTEYTYPMSAQTPLPWLVVAGGEARRDPSALLRVRRDVVEALEHDLRRRMQDVLLNLQANLITILDRVGGLLPTSAVVRMLAERTSPDPTTGDPR